MKNYNVKVSLTAEYEYVIQAKSRKQAIMAARMFTGEELHITDCDDKYEVHEIKELKEEQE